MHLHISHTWNANAPDTSHTGKNTVSAKQGSTCKEVSCLHRQQKRKSYKIFGTGKPCRKTRKSFISTRSLAPTREKEQHRIPTGEVQESEKVALMKGIIHKSSLVTSASNSSKTKGHFPSKRYWLFCTRCQGTREAGSREKPLCGALWDTQPAHNLCCWSILTIAATETLSCLQVRAVVSLTVRRYHTENSLLLVLLMHMQQHRLSAN